MEYLDRKTPNHKVELEPNKYYFFEYPGEKDPKPKLELNVSEVKNTGSGNMAYVEAIYTSGTGKVTRNEQLLFPIIPHFTIGRDPASTLCTPEDPSVSGTMAKISLEGGKLVYYHKGSNVIAPPTSNAMTPIPAIINDGTGGTFSEINKRGDNEDRILLTSAPPLSDAASEEFLRATLKDVIENTSHKSGGSTLSLAMRTKDGHYACAHVGDSPIYLIAHKPDTHEVKLVQLSLPHNMQGGMMRMALKEMKHHGPLDFEKARALTKNKYDTYVAPHIMHGLGRMTHDTIDPRFSKADFYVADPANHTPPGFECKGAMVCSDGVLKGVANGEVQKAISGLFKASDNPTLQQISQATVEAALPHDRDNVSAACIGNAGIAVVADGNTNTARVAERAVSIVHARCLAAIRGTAMLNGQAENGASLPPSDQSPDIKRGTEPPSSAELQ